MFLGAQLIGLLVVNQYMEQSSIAYIKTQRKSAIIHNVSELFIYSGLAVIFVDVLKVPSALLLLVLISLYDMYAVWKSQHMVTLAKFQADSGVFAGLMIGKSPEKKISKKSTSKTKKTTESTMAVLGGGDIGFPLLFSATVMKSQGIIPAIVISVTTTIALGLLLFLAKKDRFYPAMPYITMGALVGMALLAA